MAIRNDDTGRQTLSRHRILVYLFISLGLTAMCGLSYGKEVTYRQQGPHVHGVAQLNIAQDGDTLVLELQSPAINMLGFEHFPTNTKQRQVVAHAIAILQNAQPLFVLPPAAGCQLQKVDVDTPLIGKLRKLEHTDLNASYRFQCHAVTALDTISVNLFRKFPSIKAINVQMLTDKGQSATRLTAQHTTIDF